MLVRKLLCDPEFDAHIFVQLTSRPNLDLRTSSSDRDLAQNEKSCWIAPGASSGFPAFDKGMRLQQYLT